MFGYTPPRLYNRITEVMAHTTRYAFKGQARLAADVGVCRSTISRLARGVCLPSYALVCLVTWALEGQLNRSLDPRELFSLDGSYPTRNVCTLVGCRGCLPDGAYDAQDNLKPAYQDVQPGTWSVADPPAAGPREGA